MKEQNKTSALTPEELSAKYESTKESLDQLRGMLMPFLKAQYEKNRKALERREKKDCYFVPDELDECVFRLAEWQSHPTKEKHRCFVKWYLESHPENRGELDKRVKNENIECCLENF